MTTVLYGNMPEYPYPIPEGWRVMGYRNPVQGDMYVDRAWAKPLLAQQLVYLERCWILEPDRANPIPEGWRAIDYRVPRDGERYFSELRRPKPWRKGQGTLPGKKWIVMEA